MSLSEFREDARAWLSENVPESLRGSRDPEPFSGGRKAAPTNPDVMRWFDACYERGWTVPSWPKEFGGGGLAPAETRALYAEMAAAGAPSPLGGMGVTMIGPTLLEYGSDEQKARHLNRIASGEIRWCQGYSEPGAGSDLASLSTRAVDQGDYYLVNGSKIWTSGADLADWIFCLVRTNPDAPKHEGISFLLFSMDDPGVSVKPIRLIAGNSPFCQCFFDDVKVPKTDLIGSENRGWTIAKRLLQHERSMISGFGGGEPSTPRSTLGEMAKSYVGETDGIVADPATRSEVTSYEMDARAFALTQRRSMQENTSGGTPTFATSMFKYYSTELFRRRSEAVIAMQGVRGLGWEGSSFTPEEARAHTVVAVRQSLHDCGGSSEVQLNIIAKRVLGLPD